MPPVLLSTSRLGTPGGTGGETVQAGRDERVILTLAGLELGEGLLAWLHGKDKGLLSAGNPDGGRPQGMGKTGLRL